MPTAIAVREPMAPAQFLEAAKACKEIGESFAAMVGAPLACGPAIAMVCLAENITPLDYVRTYHTIQGKPTMRADAMLARFNAAGWEHKVVEASPTRAAISIWPAGKPSEIQDFEWTWEQAAKSRWPYKDAANTDKGMKDNWSTPEDRENMMWARLVSKMIRRVAPQIVAGLYTPEEMGDVIEGEFKVVTARPTKSAEELAQEAAARAAQTNALPAPSAPADDDAEDADFEVALGEEVSVGQQLDQDMAVKMAAHDARGGKPPITQKTMDKLLALLAELDVSDEQRTTMLTKRNAKAIADLSEDDARAIVTKLESAKAQRSANPT